MEREADSGHWTEMARQLLPPHERSGYSQQVQIERWRQEYVEAFGKYLNGFLWQVFSTATFRNHVSVPRAQRVVEKFLAGMAAFAFVAYEEGEWGDRVHAHMLVAGLTPIAASRGHLLWPYRDRRNGDIEWEPYDRSLGGCYYASKTCWTRPEASSFLDFRLPDAPAKIRRRRRGPRR